MSNMQPNSTLEKLDAIKEGIEGLFEHAKQVASEAKLPDNKSEIVTFDLSGWTFDAKGYPYAGLYVSGPQTLQVNFMGQSFPLTLTEGFNPLVVPNGATLTASKSFTALFMWTATPPATNDVLATMQSLYKVPQAFSTNTPLAASGQWNSGPIDLVGLGIKVIYYRIFTDQAGNYKIGYSDDGETFDWSGTSTITANTLTTGSITSYARYVQLQINNTSASPQTVLRASGTGTVL